MKRLGLHARFVAVLLVSIVGVSTAWIGYRIVQFQQHLAVSAQPSDPASSHEAYRAEVVRVIVEQAVGAVVLFGMLYWGADVLLLRRLAHLRRNLAELRESQVTHAPPHLDSGEEEDELTDIIRMVNALNERSYEARRQLQESVNQSNSALVATVSQLQQYSLDLKQRTEEKEQALRQLEQLATTDSLTGLHNRRYFEDRAAAALARVRRFNDGLAMILLDVDKFKQINDTLGHDCGDAVLRTLAELIRSRTRESDVSARLGGDEFVFLLEQTSAAEATQLAEDLLAKVVTHDFRYQDDPLQVTLSVGVAHYARTPPSITALYKSADEVLYEAKKRGRNQVVAAAYSDVPVLVT